MTGPKPNLSGSLLKIDPSNTFNKSQYTPKQILFSVPNVYNELIVNSSVSEIRDSMFCAPHHDELTSTRRLLTSFLYCCVKRFL